MRLGANHFHCIEQRHVTLVVIGGVGVELDAVVLDGDLREARSLGLTEHAGEQVEVILYVVVMVVKDHSRVFAIVTLHSLTAVRIVTLVTASSANEIERTVIGAERTALLTGHVLVPVNLHLFDIADGAQYRCAVVGINRADDLVGVVMTL